MRDSIPEKETGSSSNIRQSLLQEFAELSSLIEPDLIFSEILRIVSEYFNCSSCYVMTLCDTRNILELSGLFDFEKMLSFSGPHSAISDLAEGSAVKNRQGIYIDKWINGDGNGNFVSVKHDRMSMICEPLICEGDVWGTLSIFFENAQKWSKKKLSDLKFACSYIAMAVRRAENNARSMSEMKIKLLAEDIYKCFYEDENFQIRKMEKLISSRLGALRTVIAFSEMYLSNNDFCSKPGISQCTAIKLSASIEQGNCPYRVFPDTKKHIDASTYSYCIPIKRQNAEYGVFSVEYLKNRRPNCFEEGLLSDISATIANIVDHFSKTANYEKLLETMGSLLEVNSDMGLTLCIDDVLQRLSHVLSSVIRADIVKIWLLSDDGKQFTLISSWSVDGSKSGVMQVSSAKGIAGWVLRNKSQYRTSDVINDPLFMGPASDLKKVKSIMAVPLILTGKVIGVMEVFSTKSEYTFQRDYSASLNINTLSSSIAFIVDRAKLMRINEDYLAQLKKYAEDLEQKSRDLEKANNHTQLMNRRLATGFEFSRIFSTIPDVLQAIAATIQKLEFVLADKPSFITAALFDDSFRYADIVLLETSKGKIKILHVDIKTPSSLDFLKKLEESKKMAIACGEELMPLAKALELETDPEIAFAWPVLLPNGQMIALFAVGYNDDVFISEDDEMQLTSLAQRLAVPIRNGKLNKASVIQKNKLKAILNSITDGVITLDFEQKITACNKAALEISGLKEEELLNTSYSNLFGSFPENQHSDISLYGDMLNELASTNEKKIFTHEFSRTGKNGNVRFFDSTISPINYDGRNLGAVIVLRDVTDKKLLEQIKNDFIAIIAHDLKTPLTAVKGYASILLNHEAKLKKGQKKEFYMIINSEMDRFSRLLGNLTNLGQMQLGKLVADPVPFDMGGLLVKVVNLHKLNTSKHFIDIRNVPDSIFVYADKDHVEQVINNLLSNAIKYSPDGGNIVVNVYHSPDRSYVNISVTDSGIGISEENQKLLFDRYSRLHTEDTKKIAGTGLGLYICKILVEANGGEISIESEIGIGSTINLKLPSGKKY